MPDNQTVSHFDQKNHFHFSALGQSKIEFHFSLAK